MRRRQRQKPAPSNVTQKKGKRKRPKTQKTPTCTHDSEGVKNRHIAHAVDEHEVLTSDNTAVDTDFDMVMGGSDNDNDNDDDDDICNDGYPDYALGRAYGIPSDGNTVPPINALPRLPTRVDPPRPQKRPKKTHRSNDDILAQIIRHPRTSLIGPKVGGDGDTDSDEGVGSTGDPIYGSESGSIAEHTSSQQSSLYYPRAMSIEETEKHVQSQKDLHAMKILETIPKYLEYIMRMLEITLNAHSKNAQKLMRQVAAGMGVKLETLITTPTELLNAYTDRWTRRLMKGQKADEYTRTFLEDFAQTSITQHVSPSQLMSTLHVFKELVGFIKKRLVDEKEQSGDDVKTDTGPEERKLKMELINHLQHYIVNAEVENGKYSIRRKHIRPKNKSMVSSSTTLIGDDETITPDVHAIVFTPEAIGLVDTAWGRILKYRRAHRGSYRFNVNVFIEHASSEVMTEFASLMVMAGGDGREQNRLDAAAASGSAYSGRRQVMTRYTIQDENIKEIARSQRFGHLERYNVGHVYDHDYSFIFTHTIRGPCAKCASDRLVLNGQSTKDRLQSSIRQRRY